MGLRELETRENTAKFIERIARSGHTQPYPTARWLSSLAYKATEVDSHGIPGGRPETKISRFREKWQAIIFFGGRNKHLGLFDSEEIAAYEKARIAELEAATG